MSDNIVIGKHTLESLTSGMYSDPLVVFREYIQNSVDSIDLAIDSKIMDVSQSLINITLSPSERKIIIKDNGSGLSIEDAEKTLISIGNSKKSSSNSRGFRGIGRLAALSYCNSLTFITSSFGENKGTKITIDASQLATLLATDDGNDVTVVEVLKSVYSVEHFAEKENEHYFTVLLEGVAENSGLCSYDDVYDYLVQNIPVPYHPSDFEWGKEISGRIKKEGYSINAYNVSVTYGTTTTQIYKSYRDQFVVDKNKNITDSIKDIEVIKVMNTDGTISAIGWIGINNYLGSIYDKSIKGIRFRKGNILVGDSQTLNVLFKDARFNGWTIGEIFAIDKALIPNARRDNFEKNPAYFNLIEQLTGVAARITKDIRTASVNRNTDFSKVIEQSGKAKELAENALNNGVSSSQKGAVKQKLISAQEALTNLKVKDASEAYYRSIAFDELDMLIGKLQGATTYKALNTIEKLNNTEKRILERVFNIIVNIDNEHSEELINSILDEFISK